MGDSIFVSLWRWLTGQESRRAELGEAEMAQVIDEQARELLNMNAQTFALKLRAGELDRHDWRVEYLAGLVE